MDESSILYEKGDYWICKGNKGEYEVYRNTITHSERVAIIGYNGDKGLQLAILECDRRAALKTSHKK